VILIELQVLKNVLRPSVRYSIWKFYFWLKGDRNRNNGSYQGKTRSKTILYPGSGNGHIGSTGPDRFKTQKQGSWHWITYSMLPASGDFKGLTNTPRTAIPLGVKKIMKARPSYSWRGEKKNQIL